MPLLSSFHENESKAGFISMLTQIGYGLGLFFLTPLGDRFNKKYLAITLQSILFVILIFISFSGSLFQVWLCSLLIGIFSVSAQVIMPMAAGLDNENRGKNAGTIFTGILIGILSARVFSGAIAAWLGWRYVYLISSVALFTVTILLEIFLPNVRNPFKGNYKELLLSALGQLRIHPLLRSTSLIGAVQFGLFCSFWTTLTFYLSGKPFEMHSDSIGLFGLVAIAGALMAPILGKRTDKGSFGTIRFLSASLILVSSLFMIVFPFSILVLILAVLLLDIGVQAMQVTNIALIYSLDECSHSRINTIFMTSVFTGGALGTFLGLGCWHHMGWMGVNLQILTSGCFILLMLIYEHQYFKKITSTVQIKNKT